LGTIAVLLQSY